MTQNDFKNLTLVTTLTYQFSNILEILTPLHTPMRDSQNLDCSRLHYQLFHFRATYYFASGSQWCSTRSPNSTFTDKRLSPGRVLGHQIAIKFANNVLKYRIFGISDNIMASFFDMMINRSSFILSFP